MSRASRVLIFFLILSIAFAFGFAAIESVHDCHGEDCPICRIIALLTAFLGAIAFLVFTFAGFLRSERTQAAPRVSVRFVTPVALKVKLSN